MGYCVPELLLNNIYYNYCLNSGECRSKVLAWVLACVWQAVEMQVCSGTGLPRSRDLEQGPGSQWEVDELTGGSQGGRGACGGHSGYIRKGAGSKEGGEFAG